MDINVNCDKNNLCEGNVYIKMCIQGHVISSLVDTGSSTNLISGRLIEKLGLTQGVVRGTFKLVGVTGAPLQTLGILKNVPVVIDGHSIAVDFIVTNLFNEDCILGQTFLSEQKVVIDFNTRSLRNASFSAPLKIGPRDSGKILLVTSNDVVISGLDTIPCTLQRDGTKEQLTGIEGLFDIIISPQFECINIKHEMHKSGDSMVAVKDGKAEIPIAIDTNELEIWMPKNTVVAEATPVVYSNKLEQLEQSSKLCYQSDDDPDRIATLIAALKVDENESLSEDQKGKVKELIAEFPDVWALDRMELRRTNLVCHEIQLSSDKPVRAPYRRVPLHLRADCIKELEELLEAGIIEQSQSDYNTPVLVLKRGSKTRLILDFRALNNVTVRSYATVPALNTILAGCHGCELFSSLDFRDGFLQVPLKPAHKKYTAFAIPGIGFFQFTVLPLGLCGSPGTFQNLLDRVLAGCPPEVASNFVDDILSPAPDFETMLSNLRIIFGRIRVSRLRLNPEKCQIFQTRLKYCGVYLSKEGVEADQEKIRAVINMQIPKTMRDVRRFLGCCSWFRGHISNFAVLAKGVTDALKCEKLVVTEEFMDSFNQLKEALTKPPVLTFPSPNLEMLVYTDASEIAIAGCIGHKINGSFHPIAYASKILNSTEQKWASFKRELYSLWYHVTVCWRYYLINAQFTCFVDMKAITYDNFLKKTNSAVLLRWILELSADYSFTIKYLEGRLLDVPDCLSRLPQTSDQLFQWWREFDNRRPHETQLETVEENPIEIHHVSMDQRSGTVLKVHSSELTIASVQFDTTSSDSSSEYSETDHTDDETTDDKKEASHVSDLERSAEESDVLVKDGSDSSDADSEKQGYGSFSNPIPAYNSQVLKIQQEQDSEIRSLKQWITKKQKPSDVVEVAKFSNSLRKYWRYFEHMCISKEGLVCYKYYSAASKKFRELICVPESAQEEMIMTHHDLKSCGHLGPQKTLERIRAKYYFENMTAKVKYFCSTCAVCFSINEIYRKNPKAPLKLFPACRPGQFLAIDLIGRIEGPIRFKWILTMLDKFTRLVRAVPLTNAEAPTIAKSLLEDWFLIYGVPEQVLSDRAGNLTTAKTMKILYNLMSIYKLQTTSYHAQGNGQCENYNKHVVVVLKKLVEDKPSSWPELLPVVCFALNSSVCKTTKFTPFRLHFGRDIRTPTDLIHDTTTTEFYKSGAHLATASFYELREVFDLVRANNVNGLLTQKAAYDKKKGFHTSYQVGDHVLLWKPLSPSIKHYRKLKNCFSGPWEIVEILSQWTYRIRNIDTMKIEIAHFDSLRFMPPNLRIKKKVDIPDKAADDEQDEAADSTDVESDEDTCLSMLLPEGHSNPQTDPAAPLRTRDDRDNDDQRPVRSRHPPVRLQVDGMANQRYEEQ